MSIAPLFDYDAAFDAASITATTSSELNAAIKVLSATTGGTVYVDGSGGPYILNAKYLGDDGQNVLIKPLNDDEPPHVQEVNVVNSSNLTITGMHIDSEDILATRTAWTYDVNVINSSNISFVGNDMQGRATEFKSETNGADWGQKGAILRDSENITFNHNTIEGYKDGIVYLEVKGLDISGNDISGIQGDGMRGGGIQDATITNNYLHDFYGTTQTLNHSDMIQIWGTSIDTVTQNVEISGNILDAGNGAATQGILILNEQFTRTGYYSNISIHDNVIHNALAQGIGVDHVLGLEVYDNTVLWNQNATTLTRDGADPVGTFPRLILRDSPDAYVAGNIVGTSVLNEAPVTGTDNIILSYTNPTAEYYAADHFVNLSHQGDLGLTDLALRPDSPLYNNFGAALSSDPLSEDGAIANGMSHPDLLAVISQSALPGAMTGVSLSAEFSIVDGVPITDSSASVKWIFADGSTQQGIQVNQIFETPGDHEITLEITRADGTVDTMTRQFHSEDPHLLDLDFSADGIVDLSSYASELSVRDPNGDGMTGGRDGHGGFKLTGKDKIFLDRDNTQFTGLDNFRIDIGLHLTETGSFGDLAMLHKAFNLKVLADGSLKFSIDTTEGGKSVTSEVPVLTDTDWHDISVVFDGPAGQMHLEVDGTIVGTSEASGASSASTGYDMVIGSQFGTSVKAEIDHFSMTAQPSAIYVGTTTPDVEPDPEPDTDLGVDPDTDPDTGTGTDTDPDTGTDEGGTTEPTILSNMTSNFFSFFGAITTEPEIDPAPAPAWGASLFDILTQTGWYTEDLPQDEEEDLFAEELL